ncbi:MAG: aminodeoxychorismate synthase component I [Elusimicrobia bacterium]|nr:aminodeoxychorismate synthase component I [Elusimicrobiota bacterium]
MIVYTKFDNKPYLFDSHKEIITCRKTSEIKKTFEKMDSFLNQGYYLAGFISYEAGYSFEEKLDQEINYSFPLIYMGCYEKPFQANDFLKKAKNPFSISNIHPSISFEDYHNDIHSIRSFISTGDVYQITYCHKMKFAFKGDALSLFRQLLVEQPVPYPAYIETEKFKILSLSPEMFVHKKGRIVNTKPMKGTWPRGNNFISDLAAGYRLKYDKKNRAENVMIADLLRNDLGRIADKVWVKRLFEVAPYTTLYQMTSSVSANVDQNISLYELFKAIFPSGSVTGAPKIRAMEIIRQLEGEERRIYTGAIGFIAPDRTLYFNVPIRTLLLDGDQGEMGVGGGIIWDSTSEGEWAESMLKAKFLTRLSKNSPA